MDEETNFITCLTWIKRGVAKEIPDVVTLDKEELRELINLGKTKQSTHTGDDDEEIEDDNDSDGLDQYQMDNYDDEDEENNAMSLAGLTYYSCNDEDPNLTLKDEEDDSDGEDIKIKPNDNLIVVGHGKKDDSILEIYVYNEDDDDLYVHHDIPLAYMPLCVEWLDFDSTDADTGQGNFVAVGGMCPQIDVWDVDVVNCLEPEFSLTKSKKSKATKKKKKSEVAVLSLSWNKLVRNVLASAYDDSVVALWDLSTGKDVTSITGFDDKVQSLVWHPFEAETLLTGSSDKSVKIFDCRAPQSSIKSWKCDSEVENVIWNHFDPFLCLASTDKGNVFCFDARSDGHVWKLDAHSDSCTGLALSSKCPGYLVTASVDKYVKIWDILDNKPSLVLQRPPNVGEIYCAAMSPDSAFTIAFGGKHKVKPFKIMNTISKSAVNEKFGSRSLMERCSSSKDSDKSSKEVGDLEIVNASASTSRDNRVSKKGMLKKAKNTEKVKSKKKLKQPKSENVIGNDQKRIRKKKLKAVKDDAQ